MNLFEYSQRVKKLMLIEQSESNMDSYLKEFSSGSFDNLGEFLTQNSNLSDKLQ